MAIDASVVGSVGWWMNRLALQLQRDQQRFALLEAYRSGRPPLAWGSENTQSKFYRFQKTSRTNFADVIVEAPSRRVRLRSVGTAADNDANGDAAAWALLKANGIVSALPHLTRLAKTFGRAYVATAAPLVPGGPAVITIEDPRQCITESHPIMPHVQRAAFKAYYDAEAAVDVAILWLPGEKWVATRERTGPIRPPRSAGLLGQQEPVQVRFVPGSFDLAPVAGVEDDPTKGFFSEQYEDQEIPVDVVLNKDGVGEFELHTDLLDRINHMILQRVYTATVQAFRQRALKQSTDAGVDPLPEKDEAGNDIDYTSLLEGGPDAVWLLPPGAELWESGQVDLSGMLQSVKDDVLHLAAATSTPMNMFTPDAVAQSAQGAQLMREEMVFKVEEFEETAEAPLARAIARAFRFMGDTARGDASQVSLLWRPPERYALAEMGSAAAQAGDTLTWEQKQDVIWQQTPQQIDVAKAQRAEDMVLAMQQARILAQPAPGTPQAVQQPEQPRTGTTGGPEVGAA